MNCQEFELLVVDLVRGEVADSTLGAQCWAHASACPRCADRLLTQEKLTAGLEALAAASERVSVPDRIESVLRDQFRSAAARSGSNPAPRVSVARPARLVGMVGSRLAWAMAFAAAVLITAAAVISKWHGSAIPRLTAQSVNGSRTAPPLPAKPTDAQNKGSRETAQPPAAKKASSSGAKHAPAGSKTTSKPHPTIPARQNPNDLLASDFIWLPYGSGVPLEDGWAIIRVSMPRSELASLGVTPLAAPVSYTQASAPTLRADVVLGQDGLARAIRFVE